jgi:hypothetical protein
LVPVHAPESPAALHLLAILAHLPPEVRATVALPAPEPDWLRGFSSVVEITSDTAQGRLEWEQRRLPRIAQEQNASLIHFLTLTSPLFGRQAAVISPSISQESGLHADRSFARRLLASVQAGGLTRTRALFWPEGCPFRRSTKRRQAGWCTCQVVHPGFSASSDSTNSGVNGSAAREQSLLALDLPETFILYHGPGEAGLLDRLLKSWSWAAGAIGEYYPLLLLGLDESEKRLLASLAIEHGVEENARALPQLEPGLVPALYRRCSALYHPAPVRLGGAVQHAPVCGVGGRSRETS